MPPVQVAESEYERLANLAASNTSRGAALLGDELARAAVLKDDAVPGSVVRLGSVVAFTDLMTARTRRVQVVLPDDADIDRGRLSVLTPVGAALLGLTAGDSIAMSTEAGRSHVLRVEAVEAGEAAGAV
ncbi:MAG: GreA/GreB family elongation factor [Phenylobacterium sp.]|uniref:GreA/GreB family elongation factor n=1 Tax=Phenylobacterium sp. TaxID=1871053 RepID=UPI001A4E7B25|nr:GreA/GreB family elongation factor [Phenylobacterium sp.]MBL8556185.1 GreA/GreB family elongation factor [Phenylobacterium sp.]